MLSIQAAKKIAGDYIHKTNQENWDGKGMLPPSVDLTVNSYDMASEKGYILTISLEFNAGNNRWEHVCRLIGKTGNIAYSAKNTNVGSLKDLASTLRNLCRNDR